MGHPGRLRRPGGLPQVLCRAMIFCMDGTVFSSAVYCRDPKAAVAWLEAAFGFEVVMAIEGPPGGPAMGHYEMSAAGPGRIVIGGQWADWTRSPASAGGVNTQSVQVRLSDGIDAHCARARAAGAVIVQEPVDEFYGDRKYRALDPEGHCWTFVQHVRDVTKTEAEAALGQPIMTTNWL